MRENQGLTLATLCDMVLGEYAEDRSDDALIRAVGTLIRERDEATSQVKRLERHRDVLDNVNMNNALVCDGLKWQRDEARKWAREFRDRYNELSQIVYDNIKKSVSFTYVDDFGPCIIYTPPEWSEE